MSRTHSNRFPLVAALALALAAPTAFAGPSPGGDSMAAAQPQAAADIVDTAVAAGPFTVFAPTDAAFAALPAGTVESLLRPENKDKLVAVLTYHVVPGRVTASQVAGLSRAKTVQGGDVAIVAADGAVTVDGARVVTADVMATNGVIHVVDKVLLPND